MGIKSTQYITREQAIEMARQAILEESTDQRILRLPSMTNEELGDLLDDLLDKKRPYDNWWVRDSLSD